MSRVIQITCKSDQLLPITQLENFQGKLKSIDEQSFNKLKESIVKYGFSFPIFVWNTKILDGHQRLAAVKRLINEGYSVKGDKLPVVEIDANSAQEAAEKLLLINSRYAKIDQEGFDQFIDDFNIDLADFSGLLEIPEINQIPFYLGDRAMSGDQIQEIKNDLRNGILITIGFCDILIKPDDKFFEIIFNKFGEKHVYDDKLKDDILGALINVISNRTR